MEARQTGQVSCALSVVGEVVVRPLLLQRSSTALLLRYTLIQAWLITAYAVSTEASGV